MEQIIFDSSYLLRPATFLEDLKGSLERMAVIHFSSVYYPVFISCTTCRHSLSLIVICCNSLSFVVARCTTRCHSLSLVVIRCHSLYHSLSFVVTRCHSLSFVVPLAVTRSHSLSLVVTRCTTRLSFYKRSFKGNIIYVNFSFLKDIVSIPPKQRRF